MLYVQLLQHLFRCSLLDPKPLSPPPCPYPPNYNESAQCEYHSNSQGHMVENCRALKHEVQDLIDSKQLTFEGGIPSVNGHALLWKIQEHHEASPKASGSTRKLIPMIIRPFISICIFLLLSIVCVFNLYSLTNNFNKMSMHVFGTNPFIFTLSYTINFHKYLRFFIFFLFSFHLLTKLEGEWCKWNNQIWWSMFLLVKPRRRCKELFHFLNTRGIST